MYYKVVSSIGNKLVSARINLVNHYYDLNYDTRHIINLACVEYKINEWVKPNTHIKESKLFVFDNLSDALYFSDTGHQPEYEHIYECEVKNPLPIDMICNSLYSIIDFWSGNSPNNFSIAPEGSILCDEVKLIKRVYKTTC